MSRKSFQAMVIEKINRANAKLIAALVCYLILAAAAVWMLDGFLRGAVLCFLAILAVKTIAHAGDEMPG